MSVLKINFISYKIFSSWFSPLHSNLPVPPQLPRHTQLYISLENKQTKNNEKEKEKFKKSTRHTYDPIKNKSRNYNNQTKGY